MTDLTGQRFGRLVFLAFSGRNKTGLTKWLCRCDCGNEKVFFAGAVTSGHTKSCGCLRTETAGDATRKHGMTRTDEFRIWRHMKSRCLNPNVPGFKDWGGRGITICEEWVNSFEAFLNDMGPRPSKHHSIERKDNSSGYNKQNCKWATRIEQGLNKRNNILIEMNGVVQPLSQWCRDLGLRYGTIHARIKDYGWSPVDALTRN